MAGAHAVLSRQEGEQGCRSRTRTNGDQVRVLFVQKLRIAAVGIGNEYALHGKVRLLGTDGKPQLALGAHYLNFGSTPGSLTSFYLTGSAPLLKRDGDVRLRGHLGVIHQHVTGFAPESLTRPMVGYLSVSRTMASIE